MVLQAHLKVRHRGCASEHVTSGARAIHLSGESGGCLAILRAAEPEHLQRVLRAYERHYHLKAEDVVDRADDWVVVRCSCLDKPGVVAAITSMDCTVVWPSVEADGLEHYTVLAPSRSRLKALVDRLNELGSVTVERVADVPGDAFDGTVPISAVTGALSSRQLDALLKAIKAGYYDSPRRTSAEALAKTMGVSRSTFQEHLRKAEAVLLMTFARTMAGHPAAMRSLNGGRTAAAKTTGAPARTRAEDDEGPKAMT